MYIILAIIVMYISLIICYTSSVRWKRYLYIPCSTESCAKVGEEMPISDQRKEYLYGYQKSKLKRIPLDVQKEKYEEIKAAADRSKESVNGYIKKAIDERMKRENSENPE